MLVITVTSSQTWTSSKPVILVTTTTVDCCHDSYKLGLLLQSSDTVLLTFVDLTSRTVTKRQSQVFLLV
jgi:hypothetical protein